MKTKGEHPNCTQKGPGQTVDSDLGPSCCEAFGNSAPKIVFLQWTFTREHSLEFLSGLKTCGWGILQEGLVGGARFSHKPVTDKFKFWPAPRQNRGLSSWLTLSSIKPSQARALLLLLLAEKCNPLTLFLKLLISTHILMWLGSD